MKRYIDANKLKEDILEENSWYLYNEFGSPTQFHELIDKQPTANVVEVTDQSMIPLVKDFVKDLEKLGGRATCADIIKSMKR